MWQRKRSPRRLVSTLPRLDPLPLPPPLHPPPLPQLLAPRLRLLPTAPRVEPLARQRGRLKTGRFLRRRRRRWNLLQTTPRLVRTAAAGAATARNRPSRPDQTRPRRSRDEREHRALTAAAAVAAAAAAAASLGLTAIEFRTEGPTRRLGRGETPPLRPRERRQGGEGAATPGAGRGCARVSSRLSAAALSPAGSRPQERVQAPPRTTPGALEFALTSRRRPRRRSRACTNSSGSSSSSRWWWTLQRRGAEEHR